MLEFKSYAVNTLAYVFFLIGLTTSVVTKLTPHPANCIVCAGKSPATLAFIFTNVAAIGNYFKNRVMAIVRGHPVQKQAGGTKQVVQTPCRKKNCKHHTKPVEGRSKLLLILGAGIQIGSHLICFMCLGGGIVGVLTLLLLYYFAKRQKIPLIHKVLSD